MWALNCLETHSRLSRVQISEDNGKPVQRTDQCNEINKYSGIQPLYSPPLPSPPLPSPPLPSSPLLSPPLPSLLLIDRAISYGVQKTSLTTGGSLSYGLLTTCAVRWPDVERRINADLFVNNSSIL